MDQILGRVSLYYNNIFVGTEFECSIGQEIETFFHDIDGEKIPVQKRVIDQTVAFYSSLDEENDLLETTIKLSSCVNNFCRIEELNHKIILYFSDIILYERISFNDPFKFEYKTLKDKQE